MKCRGYSCFLAAFSRLQNLVAQIRYKTDCGRGSRSRNAKACPLRIPREKQEDAHHQRRRGLLRHQARYESIARTLSRDRLGAGKRQALERFKKLKTGTLKRTRRHERSWIRQRNRRIRYQDFLQRDGVCPMRDLKAQVKCD